MLDKTSTVEKIIYFRKNKIRSSQKDLPMSQQ